MFPFPEDVAQALASNATGIPASLTYDYLAESTDGPSRAAIIFLLLLTSAFVILRLYGRFFIVKQFGSDDGLAILSLVSPHT